MTPVGQRRACARARSVAVLMFAWCVLSLQHPARCADEWEYIVVPGDTLWDLTEKYLSDLSFVPRLQELNQVADPSRMTPGTRLRMPMAWTKNAPGDARFVAVHGDVRIEEGSRGAERTAVTGVTVSAGDIVRTRADGHAALAFFDGSVVSLHPDSTLLLEVIRSYAAGLNRIRMELMPGRAEARVRPQPAPASRFEIETPAGITSVRGTEFRVSVPADEKASRVEVLDGTVVVAGGGKEVAVPAGFGVVVQAGSPPAAPLALLPPPDLTGLPATLVKLPAEIEFPRGRRRRCLPCADGQRHRVRAGGLRSHVRRASGEPARVAQRPLHAARARRRRRGAGGSSCAAAGRARRAPSPADFDRTAGRRRSRRHTAALPLGCGKYRPRLSLSARAGRDILAADRGSARATRFPRHPRARPAVRGLLLARGCHSSRSRGGAVQRNSDIPASAAGANVRGGQPRTPAAATALARRPQRPALSRAARPRCGIHPDRQRWICRATRVGAATPGGRPLLCAHSRGRGRWIRGPE